MESLKTFRHEYKYVIPYEEMLSLKMKFNEAGFRAPCRVF